MKVSVSFRQHGSGKALMKDIELSQIPSMGMSFEYQDGYGLGTIREPGHDRGLYSYVTADGGGIDGYGPQFSEEETLKLISLGWRLA